MCVLIGQNVTSALSVHYSEGGGNIVVLVFWSKNGYNHRSSLWYYPYIIPNIILIFQKLSQKVMNNPKNNLIFYTRRNKYSEKISQISWKSCKNHNIYAGAHIATKDSENPGHSKKQHDIFVAKYCRNRFSSKNALKRASRRRLKLNIGATMLQLYHPTLSPSLSQILSLS